MHVDRTSSEALGCFDRYRAAWAEDLDLLGQNELLNEGPFIRFVRDRRLPVQGVVSGDPGVFYERGWLHRDGLDYQGNPRFHPFRFYALLRILQSTRQTMTVSRTSTPGGVTSALQQMIGWLPAEGQAEEIIREANSVVDLVVLLEPVYWPRITGQVHLPIANEERFNAAMEQYRAKVLRLAKTLDPEPWRKVHESLRLEAHRMDPNDELYLLLRLADWKKREQLSGALSGSLWLRQMAEVLRRAFEEAHGELWPEEDQAAGRWRPGGRTRSYGTERPLDDEALSRPYLAWEHGLLTGSIVRWYVEGPTEYFAVLEILAEPSRAGIELVNLDGTIATEKGNAPLRLKTWLAEDRRFRRFSMISFDRDVKANVRAIRRQVEQDNIVGVIFAQEPDFEFANFSMEELVEIAAGIDDAEGYSGEAVRAADWSGIQGAGSFESRYCQVSARTPRGLKGEAWGRALARYAVSQPQRCGRGTERPLISAVVTALRSRIWNYDYSRDHFRFDAETFEMVARNGDSK